MVSREGEFLLDLECGGTGTTSEDEGTGDVFSGNSGGRRLSNRGNLEAGFISNVINVDKSDSFSKLNDFGGTGAENSGGDDVRDLAAMLENRNSNPNPNPNPNPYEQHKIQVPKNATKPPRPPKGPLLTASDLKLVKEFTEIAARKRARIEQIKAFRKMKESKKTSSSSSIVAMLITVLFFVVIVLQGIFSDHSFTRKFQGSTAPATMTEGLISIQLFNNAPTYEKNLPISMSPNSVELASGSSPQVQEGRDAR